MAGGSDSSSSASYRSRSRVRRKYKTSGSGKHSAVSKNAVLSGSITGSASTSKECKAGRITRNPFINFLREFRLNNSDMNPKDIIREGGAVWRKMHRTEKEPYFKQAGEIPKGSVKRRRRCSGCGRKLRSRSKSYGKRRQAANQSYGKKKKRSRSKCSRKKSKSRRKSRLRMD